MLYVKIEIQDKLQKYPTFYKRKKSHLTQEQRLAFAKIKPRYAPFVFFLVMQCQRVDLMPLKTLTPPLSKFHVI
jgi:hypothetical protein